MSYEYTRPLTVLKSVGPKTVPFFKTVAIFFVLYPTDEGYYNPVFFSIAKILPIASLIMFVLLHGMNFSEAYSYSWKILIGLVFSALGDVFLVLKDYGFFLHGIASFAMAQFLYAWAFDIWPLKLYVGGICAVIASTIYLFLLPGLHGVMVYVGAVYCTLIFTMMWRAIARVQFFNDQWVFTHDLWKWTKLCSCIGAFFFVISDFTIAFDKFVQPVPYAHAIIMFTYYAAQFHITVSVVDSQVDEVMRITREEEEGTYTGYIIMKIQEETREPVQKIKHGLQKIQEEAREPVQKIREGLASATSRIENLDTIRNIRQGISSIENSERVQKLRQGLAEAQLRLESSEPVQIIKQGITRLEPVQRRIRHRLSSLSESEAQEQDVTSLHQPGDQSEASELYSAADVIDDVDSDADEGDFQAEMTSQEVVRPVDDVTHHVSSTSAADGVAAVSSTTLRASKSPRVASKATCERFSDDDDDVMTSSCSDSDEELTALLALPKPVKQHQDTCC